MGLLGRTKSLTISSAVWIQSTNATDRRTDGQTPGDSRPRLRISSRGKNESGLVFNGAPSTKWKCCKTMENVDNLIGAHFCAVGLCALFSLGNLPVYRHMHTAQAASATSARICERCPSTNTERAHDVFITSARANDHPACPISSTIK